jgi:S-(hydroxymethyl)glutathione dehydrogenase / alcohol dehydrogenase
MKTPAAVLFETNKLEVVDLDIPKLKPGQILVEVLYSGVCGTQVGEIRGLRGPDRYLPHCLGHEGSGVVREIPKGCISTVKVGDNVILSWIKDQGANVDYTLYDYNGKQINAGGVSTFQKYSVVSENRLTRIPGDDYFDYSFCGSPSLAEFSLFGCPIPTGMGVVLVTANLKMESSIIIYGAGGVGCCAVAAAKSFGCDPITVVDPNESRLSLAEKFGATSVMQSNDNPYTSIYDCAIETSGKQSSIYNAMDSVKSQGGVVVIVGNSKYGTELKINPSWLNQGRQLRGTWGGDSVPKSLLKKIRNIRVDLTLLTNDRYSLKNINEAVDDLESGKVIRPLIDMSI